METNNPPTSEPTDPTQDFREFLEQSYLAIKQKNPRYSLRAFARNLDLDHSVLSRILRGERKIHPRTIKRVGSALKLAPDLVQSWTKQETKRVPRPDRTKKKKFHLLNNDVFQFISDWHYDAIIELTKLSTFKLEAAWISEQLQISLEDATEAVERLKRHKLIQSDDSGRTNASFPDSTNILSSLQTDFAARKLQKQILSKAQQAIDNVPAGDRSQTSLTLAVQTTDLPHIREIIKTFRRQLNRYAERAGTNPDAVYQLSVSFFPLSKLEEQES